MKYTLNKSFDTRVKRTDRVLDVAEAFGLGLEDKQFHVLRDVEIDVNPGDVVYITGQSGSGKSQMLKSLQEEMAKSGKKIANIDDVEMEETPIIEQVGKNLNEALGILSRAGINDAYLVIRKPSELSDGQRYRFKMAKLFTQDADVWVADEWAAVLDRVTAKTLSFNSQKWARSLGKTLIVATTHDDMIEELAPSIIVRKRFNDRITIESKNDGNRQGAGSDE